MTQTSQAIDTQADFKTTMDIDEREKVLLDKIEEKLGFVMEKNIWKSSYWGSKTIGAANYLGKYQGKTAVLKIQGAKPLLSEIKVLKKFEAQNRSKRIRTAKLYDYIKWTDQDQFEALVLEYVDGHKVILSGKPTDEDSVQLFLEFYRDYRKNCRNKPWLDKPKEPVDVWKMLERATKIREEIYPNHPLRTKEDDELVKSGLEIIEKYQQEADLEFVHGHLSVEDVFWTKDDKFVFFSNLFWGWKLPFSDLLFGYHWFIQTLERYPLVSRELIEEQRLLFLKAMEKLPEVKKNVRLFKLARLERAVSGLILDVFAYIDPKNKAALPLIESTRAQVSELVGALG